MYNFKQCNVSSSNNFSRMICPSPQKKFLIISKWINYTLIFKFIKQEILQRKIVQEKPNLLYIIIIFAIQEGKVNYKQNNPKCSYKHFTTNKLYIRTKLNFTSKIKTSLKDLWCYKRLRQNQTTKKEFIIIFHLLYPTMFKKIYIKKKIFF